MSRLAFFLVYLVPIATGIENIIPLSHTITINDIGLHKLKELLASEKMVEKGSDSQRHKDIVNDLVSVVYDGSEDSLFEGVDGRYKTFLLMLTVAYFESKFSENVDYGLPGGIGSNKDWCLMQIRLGMGRDGNSGYRVDISGSEFKYVARNGLSGHDLVRDRKSCFRVGLRMLRYSFKKCRLMPETDRMAAYLSGSCDRGRRESRRRTQKFYEIDNYSHKCIVEGVTRPDLFSYLTKI